MELFRSKYLVILPAFNEEGSLSKVLAELKSLDLGTDILVVDDGSNDSTSQIAISEGAMLLRLPFNLGVGGAMRAGFRFAERNGYEAVVQLDADGQHNPSDIPKLLEQLTIADVVIGARFAGSGKYVVRGPRQWAMKFLSSLISKIIKTKLTDTTSGFKACGPKALKVFAENFPQEYLGDTIEALIIAHKNLCIIKQYPVEMRPRYAGVPSQNASKAAIYLFRALVAIFVGLVRPKNLTN